TVTEIKVVVSCPIVCNYRITAIAKIKLITVGIIGICVFKKEYIWLVGVTFKAPRQFLRTLNRNFKRVAHFSAHFILKGISLRSLYTVMTRCKEIPVTVLYNGIFCSA